MVQLAHATKAGIPRSEAVKIAAWAYTAILTVMAVGQLFAFENLLPLFETYGLPGGHGTASLVGCVIVLMEVFAVPFLLRMQLSSLMRWTSMVCSVLAPLSWVKLSFWVILTGKEVENTGLLGTKIAIHSVVATLFLALALLSLSIWVAWGLWPGKKSK